MKKRSWKYLILCVTAVLAFTMTAGCQTKQKPDETTPQVTTPAPIEHTYEDLTAMEIFSDMNIGWNLGNSLDAVGKGMTSETGWGNPKVTEDLIKAVKAAGFDTVRIPITWMGHFGEGPDYTIDAEWMDRVQEVVDYVLKNDMYAIINIHHDGNDTDQSWLTPVPTDEDAMVKQFTTLWTQIATRFQDYGEKLLFAGMNEFHKGYNTPKKEYLVLTDRLNQAFVDTVRATEGNNPTRVLIVQAYNTNADAALKMVMPTDKVKDKLMMEFHFYDPWDFAGSGKGDWGVNGVNKANWGQEDWVDSIFAKIRTQFYDNGIPVILGEYGAVNNKDGNDDFRRYYIEYVTKQAKANGMLPIWWDNGYDGSSGEAFAIFDRKTNEILHQDIHDAIFRAVSKEDYEITLPVAKTESE